MTLSHSASRQAALLPALAAVGLKYVGETISHIHHLPGAAIIGVVRVGGVPYYELLPPQAPSALNLPPLRRLHEQQQTSHPKARS